MTEDVKPTLLGSMRPVAPPPKQEVMGFFTDSTLCIGCKACEVACKQWNQLPADGLEWTGQSYDNTRALSATTWRHVTFTEIAVPSADDGRWTMVALIRPQLKTQNSELRTPSVGSSTATCASTA